MEGCAEEPNEQDGTYVLCGFEPSFIDDIFSSSGRATTTYFLPLVGPKERQQYNPLWAFVLPLFYSCETIKRIGDLAAFQ